MKHKSPPNRANIKETDIAIALKIHNRIKITFPCFSAKKRYLKIVGYKSTVAAFTTFTAIAQHKSQRNKMICSNGTSVNMQPIPLSPVVNRRKTISKENRLKIHEMEADMHRVIYVCRRYSQE